jgi:outer membrane protein insertion porin family
LTARCAVRTRTSRSDVPTTAAPRWVLLSALIVLFSSFGFPIHAKQDHAELDIDGYGIIGNLELKRTLRSVDLQWKEREFFDANFIEDAALIIMSHLRRDGYLSPQLHVEMIDAAGETNWITWKGTIDPPLPRPIHISTLRFHIEKGILYRYLQITFTGLTELTEEQTRAFFIERGLLLPLKQTRIYTPDKLDRSIGSLTEALMRLGYENATVNATNIIRDDATGKVSVAVDINAGKKFLVRSVVTETFVSTNAQPITITTLHTNVPFSRIWQQDFAQSLLATNFHSGYPDTTVKITPTNREPVNGIAYVDLVAQVKTGEKIFLRDVKFEGLEKTKKSVVERRVELEEDEPLNRIEAERGRHRLARLGIFDTVNLRYDTIDAHTRDAIYAVKEGKRLNVYLLAGYGSYELARAGVEMEQFNLFGRGHHARLRAVQSIKSTTADYRYTMPEFIGESVDVFFNGFYLQREEVSFTREEYGGGAGARTFVDELKSTLVARYDYQVLSAYKSGVTEGPTNATVGAITLELLHDQRDSPLYPRQDYKIGGSLETASEFLGGEVDYWRFEMQGSYHQPLDPGRWIHFGVSHGVAYALGSAQEDLPFNKRFFPGGDNSVRGFQYGEAAPRNENGKIVGAETFTVGNFEFEQALTEKFSLVTFVDIIGFARRISGYPFDEYRLSIGGGLRWKTIIGPVRLEYGHNIVKDSEDPNGTIHFSIGFPF